MKKIKRIWRENKVLFVLAMILVICLVIFAVVAVKYFYGSVDTRPNPAASVPLEKEFITNLKTTISSDKNVEDVEVSTKEGTIYLSIVYNDKTKMDDAKKVAEQSLNIFTEEMLMVYDIEFTISNSEYTLMGARNANGSGNLEWNNYNIKESTEN